MTTHQLPKRRRGQIIGAIAAKDVADGWRNRTFQGIVLAVLLTLLTAQALPMLLNTMVRQNVIIVAGRQSELMALLADHESLQVSRRSTVESALEDVATNTGGLIGILLPEEAEARLMAGEPVMLDAMTPYATSDRQLDEARNAVVQAVRDTTGAEVSLAVETVYPGVDSGGRPVMVTTSLLLIGLVPGLLIVPLLVLEEKESRTLDVLLVSPATPGDIVGGKALAGVAFGLVASAVALIVFRTMFVHWGVALLGMSLTVLLGVSIGLLLGTMFNDQASMNLWLGLALMLLVLPVGLRVMPRLDHLGEAAWYPLIPSVSLAHMLQAAMIDPLPMAVVLQSAIVAVVAIGALLAMVVWSLRRGQR